MKPRLIVIDGKTYNSVNEMPAEVRQQYEQAMGSLKDQDANGVPDAFEGASNVLADNNKNGIPDIIENTAGAPLFARSMKILMDGREFNSLDDLPPEARAKYEKAMGALDANRNGVPDFMEGMMGASQPIATPASTVSTSFGTDTTRHSAPLPVTPTIEPDTSNRLLLGLLAGLLLFFCAAAAVGVWYYFLR